MKRGNESESGESIKAEIGIVHVTVGDNKFSALALHGMGLDLGVAKFDTTRELDTTRHEISRLWVEA